MRRAIVVLLAVAAMVSIACSERRPATAAPEAGKPESVPEERIGLVAGRLEELPPLAARPAPLQEPGEAPAEPAVFEGAPPAIPHAIDDYMPITRDENLCLDCHLVEEKLPGAPTPVPASHFIDLRNAPGEQGEEVVGARWTCVSCHVVPAAVVPLVNNRFQR